MTKSISGSTLKIIAILTMLIDHIGAMFLIGSELYTPSRIIGRIAFPIFCFLLVEGFLHTRNITRYAIRLLLFAILSEIPFDLAFEGKLFYWEYQNVYFTLFIGLMTVAAFAFVEEKLADKQVQCQLTKGLAMIAGMLIAYALKTDYGYMGVLTILVLYELRRNKIQAMTGACVCLTCMSQLELATFVTLPLIGCYNGKRGLSLKYIFYIFYPAHLLILYLVGKHF